MTVVTGRLIKGLHLGGLQLALESAAPDDQPLYRRLYLRLRQAIEDGILPAGTRLPSTRTLARDLKLSRNTIAAAFDQLHADGFIRQRVGDGSYVAPLPAEQRSRHLSGRLSGGHQGSGHLSGGHVSAGADDAAPLSPSSALPIFSQRGAAFDPASQVTAEMEPVCMLARPGVDLFPRGQWRQVMMEVIGSRRVDGFHVCDPASGDQPWPHLRCEPGDHHHQRAAIGRSRRPGDQRSRRCCVDGRSRLYRDPRHHDFGRTEDRAGAGG